MRLDAFATSMYDMISLVVPYHIQRLQGIDDVLMLEPGLLTQLINRHHGILSQQVQQCPRPVAPVRNLAKVRQRLSNAVLEHAATSVFETNLFWTSRLALTCCQRIC